MPSHPRIQSAISFALACALVTSVGAQEQSDSTPKILGISHIAVKAMDVDKSCAFYHDFLGFAEQGRLNYVPSKEALMLVFFKVSDDQWIEIFDGNKVKPDSNQPYQIAFRVDDAEALRARLGANGIHVAPSAQLGQMKNLGFTARDPDKYTIEFVQYMPEGRILLDKGKYLSESRISDHISHAGVVLSNVAASNHFYGDLLGLKENWRGSSGGNVLSWIHMKVPSCDCFVELMLDSKVKPHFCLEVADIEKAKAKLDASSYREKYTLPIEIRLGKNHKRQLNLYDPDGVRVELMEATTVDHLPVAASDAPVPADKN